MQNSPSFTQCRAADNWCKWCTGPPTWYVISSFGVEQRGTTLDSPSLDFRPSSSFLEFLGLWLRSMSLSGKMCLGMNQQVQILIERLWSPPAPLFFFNVCMRFSWMSATEPQLVVWFLSVDLVYAAPLSLCRFAFVKCYQWLYFTK